MSMLLDAIHQMKDSCTQKLNYVKDPLNFELETKLCQRPVNYFELLDPEKS